MSCISIREVRNIIGNVGSILSLLTHHPLSTLTSPVLARAPASRLLSQVDQPVYHDEHSNPHHYCHQHPVEYLCPQGVGILVAVALEPPTRAVAARLPLRLASKGPAASALGLCSLWHYHLYVSLWSALAPLADVDLLVPLLNHFFVLTDVRLLLLVGLNRHLVLAEVEAFDVEGSGDEVDKEEAHHCSVEVDDVFERNSQHSYHEAHAYHNAHIDYFVNVDLAGGSLG